MKQQQNEMYRCAVSKKLSETKTYEEEFISGKGKNSDTW